MCAPRRPARREHIARISTVPARYYSPQLLGAAVSLFNLGQTDGDSVCGDCIYISSNDEGASFFGEQAVETAPKKRRGGTRQRDKELEAAQFSYYFSPLCNSRLGFCLLAECFC